MIKIYLHDVKKRISSMCLQEAVGEPLQHTSKAIKNTSNINHSVFNHFLITSDVKFTCLLLKIRFSFKCLREAVDGPFQLNRKRFCINFFRINFIFQILNHGIEGIMLIRNPFLALTDPQNARFGVHPS